MALGGLVYWKYEVKQTEDPRDPEKVIHMDITGLRMYAICKLMWDNVGSLAGSNFKGEVPILQGRSL